MTVINLVLRHPRRFAAIIAVLILGLVASSTPRVNVGYGDSDEFLAVGQTWGVAHPPGYILYTSLLHLAMQLPIPTTTAAQRAHLVSAVSLAFSLYVMTLTLLEMTAYLHYKKTNRQDGLRLLIAVVVTIITVATAKSIWLYAQIAEKYIFNLPFLALLIYWSFTAYRQKVVSLPLIAGIGFVYGLLLSHHQSMVFFLPYIGYLFYEKKLHRSVPHLGIAIGLIVIGFILPFAITFIRVQAQPAVSWNTPATVTGMIDLIRRADFTGQIYTQNIVSNGYFPKLTVQSLLNGFLSFTKEFLRSYSWWIAIPITVAVAELWPSKRRWLVFMGLPFLTLGFGMASYLGWPKDLGSQATTLRFYIPGLFAVAPLLFFGVYETIRRLQKSVEVMGIRANVGSAVALSWLIIPVVIALFSYPQVSLRSFDLVSRLYGSILDQVKPNSLVTCYSDSSCFALLYEQTVLHKRPDVDLVPLAYPLIQAQRQLSSLQGFLYTKNPYMMYDVVTWNLDKRPVYAVDLSQYYYNLFGLNNGFMAYIPQGYMGELTRQIPTDVASASSQLTIEYSQRKIPAFDLMRQYLVNSVTQTHLTNGYSWLKLGNRDRAQVELNQAVTLAYVLSGQAKQGTLDARSTIERTIPEPRYQAGKHLTGADELVKMIPELLARNYNSRAYAAAQGALTLDPTHIQARIELAKMYGLMKDSYFYRLELQNVLKLDPGNQVAKDLLSQPMP